MDVLEGIPLMQGNLPMKGNSPMQGNLSMKGNSPMQGNTILVANSIAMVDPSSWTLVSPIPYCNVDDDCFKDESWKLFWQKEHRSWRLY